MSRKLTASLAAAIVTAAAVAGAVQSDNSFAMTTQPPVLAQAATNAQTQQFSTIATESQAEQAVWAQPDVQQAAARLRAEGVRPFTMTEATPDPRAAAGTTGASYVIYFGEDHGDHVVRIQSYTVDAHTGKVAVYDPLTAD